MIRKEKTHLSRFAARAKELEAQGNETEALLSGIKEDKVGPSWDVPYVYHVSRRGRWQARSMMPRLADVKCGPKTNRFGILPLRVCGCLNLTPASLLPFWRDL